jgi:hypothetical protein
MLLIRVEDSKMSSVDRCESKTPIGLVSLGSVRKPLDPQNILVELNAVRNVPKKKRP